MKFKVGDKVIGNKKANDLYVITKEGWAGTVVKVENDHIDVKEDNGYTFSNLNAECFDLVNGSQKIVITTDGTETLARLYEGDKVVKRATARCAPEDTFDFDTGAKLAFERLMGEEKKESPFKVGDKVKIIGNRSPIRHNFNVGDVVIVKQVFPQSCYCCDKKRNVHQYISLPDLEHYEAPKKTYYNGKVLCIKSGYDWFTVGKVYEVKDGIITANNGFKYPNTEHEPYADAEDVRHAGCDSNCDGGRHNPRNEFVPFMGELKWHGAHHGNLGTPTTLKDAIGRPLFVGDVVETFNKEAQSYGEGVVCAEGKTVYVMGLKGVTSNNETPDKGWKLLKKRSYEDVKDGEKIDGVTYHK